MRREKVAGGGRMRQGEVNKEWRGGVGEVREQQG